MQDSPTSPTSVLDVEYFEFSLLKELLHKITRRAMDRK